MQNHLVLGLVALLMGGCGGHSELMADAPPGSRALGPVPDRATVVFIRPGMLGFLVNFTILDHQGNFLGESVAKSHFAIEVPPGQYFFLAKAENTDALRATLAEGRIYFVNVSPKFGTAHARVTLAAIKPNRPEWNTIPRWIADTKRLVPVRQALQEPTPIAGSAGSWVTMTWSDLSPLEQASRTLEPGDGATSTTH